MIKPMSAHYGDDTCSSCVVAGDYIFLAHHGGGQDGKIWRIKCEWRLKACKNIGNRERAVCCYGSGDPVYKEY